MCTIEAAVTGRLSDLLYERENARRAHDAPDAGTAPEGADHSTDLGAVRAALNQARAQRPARLSPPPRC